LAEEGNSTSVWGLGFRVYGLGFVAGGAFFFERVLTPPRKSSASSLSFAAYYSFTTSRKSKLEISFVYCHLLVLSLSIESFDCERVLTVKL